MFCTSTVIVSKSLALGFWKTVTSPLALGNSALMPLGTSGNCIIKVGSTEASTLTVGASWPVVAKVGVRSWGGVAGKLGPGPPMVVVPLLVGVLDAAGPPGGAQAPASKLNSTTAASMLAGCFRNEKPLLGLETLPTNWMMDPCSLLAKFSTCLNMYLLLKHRRGLPVGHGLGTGV